MKTLLICILLFGAATAYGQTKDTAAYYKYYPPHYYLKKAGKLGYGQYGVALAGGAAIWFLGLNEDMSPTVLETVGIATVGTMFIMKIAIHINIRKAGMAMEERYKVKVGLMPTGVKVAYSF